MAEVVGLAASIIQIAGAGVKLSTTLYNFAGSAGRADSDVADIADDIKLTANALDSVGKVFEKEDGKSVVSRKAMQDAESLIKRCETVFGDVQDIVNKRWKVGKDGKRSLSVFGKLSWPMKEQRVELLRRRLDSLKNSLMLLLHVLQLANGQAKGELEASALEQERERIRELHQRKQESLKALQSLEDKLRDVSLSDDETLRGSEAPSRVPTINFMVNTSMPTPRMVPNTNAVSTQNPATKAHMIMDDSETSDSDDTVTDDEDEHLTTEELSQCASHVQKLLKRITVLQQSFDNTAAKTGCRYPKHRVHKIYRRFCRRFESEMLARTSISVSSTEPLPAFVPPSKASESFQVQRHGAQGTTGTALTAGEGGRAAIRHVIEPSNIPDGHQPEGVHQHDKIPKERTSITSMYGDNDEALSPPEDSLEGNQSSMEMDIDQISQDTVPVQYTKTGRVSKAKKGLKVHTCECGKSFTRAEHLRRHQKNHGSTQVQCKLCGKVFFRADLLQRHLERHKDSSHGSQVEYAVINGFTAEVSSKDTVTYQGRPILPAPKVSDLSDTQASQTTQKHPSKWSPISRPLESEPIVSLASQRSPFDSGAARDGSAPSPHSQTQVVPIPVEGLEPPRYWNDPFRSAPSPGSPPTSHLDAVRHIHPLPASDATQTIPEEASSFTRDSAYRRTLSLPQPHSKHPVPHVVPPTLPHPLPRLPPRFEDASMSSQIDAMSHPQRPPSLGHGPTNLFGGIMAGNTRHSPPAPPPPLEGDHTRRPSSATSKSPPEPPTKRRLSPHIPGGEGHDRELLARRRARELPSITSPPAPLRTSSAPTYPEIARHPPLTVNHRDGSLETWQTVSAIPAQLSTKRYSFSEIEPQMVSKSKATERRARASQGEEMTTAPIKSSSNPDTSTSTPRDQQSSAPEINVDYAPLPRQASFQPINRPIMEQPIDIPNTERTHHSSAMLKCDFCGKQFTRAYNLRSHLRTHEKEHQFKREYERQPTKVDDLPNDHDERNMSSGNAWIRVEGRGKQTADARELTPVQAVHETRINHSLRRPRGPGGGFLTAEEVAAIEKAHNVAETTNTRGKQGDGEVVVTSTPASPLSEGRPPSRKRKLEEKGKVMQEEDLDGLKRRRTREQDPATSPRADKSGDAETGSLHDPKQGEEAEEERDIVDVLLDEWTVPVY